ncbi:endonuclease-reverse transcriptase [Plakobranchus ocellatus]|uniref:Endonuclease-reverse transcriptase n=1 Tax=Plakobranchus ocellatus TaxID=259542 RepID=A0AAV4A621_9GAST|nr:endonuclease-reverse transcriptase [Plakobranchus ocellatus]
MYRNIEEITGKKTFLSNGCIKAMNGDIIIDKEKILERWAEYIRELFKDDRKDHNIMKNNFAGPPIMKEEVETAIKKMKHGKATGPFNISVELIEALEDFGIGKVTHLLNEIYDTGQIPTDLSKSIFIALPKKPGATECELHRTISLMSHITKILLKIIMLRTRNKIKPEIAEEQCGFVEDRGISNAIYILQTLIERALEVQKDVYLCFIDYTKAFDRVRHDEIITELKQFNIDGKDLRIIKTKYWEQTAAMRIENKTSTFQDIKRGVRQGCVLSPDLFSLYSEIIMRNLENHPVIKVGGQNINNLRYADNTVLIAENKEDLQKLLNIVEEESRKKRIIQKSLLMAMKANLNDFFKKEALLGEDEHIQLFEVARGVLMARYKVDNELAFVMCVLHYHNLVSRCLSGTFDKCWTGPTRTAPQDDIDPHYGLHGYSCVLIVRNTRQKILECKFCDLFTSKEALSGNFAVFHPVRKDDKMTHVTCLKDICFPWRTSLFKGIIQNVAILDMTLLDEGGEPFWTATGMISFQTLSAQTDQFEFSPESYRSTYYEDEKGKIEMEIGRLEDGSSYLSCLDILLSLTAINKKFHTSYGNMRQKSGKSSASKKSSLSKEKSQ